MEATGRESGAEASRGHLGFCNMAVDPDSAEGMLVYEYCVLLLLNLRPCQP